MEIYSYLIILLFALALIDLIVGVSNDAVNFLNSAIGSRVAPFRTILIIASCGILVGAVFSEGMMSIARNGIFHPSFFTFEQVMIIFIAVMLTDVLLLDLYNTFALPTSTTVSLIFELLGASFAVGLMAIVVKSGDFQEIGEVINYNSALTIIGGIFLSVLVAFVVGSAVQFLTRFVFTFRIKSRVKRLGAPFAGIAITTITYFLLIKGVKGSSLINSAQSAWISDNAWEIMGISFIFWTILIALLMRLSGVNPLKAIVLLGTFALAMAFAGNDLVNFIGVSVAGLNSFQAWMGAGAAADTYTMEVLNNKIQTPSWILLASGIIMVITLWTNAKSRKVTETEVSLSSQDEGDEKFKPGLLSRILVGSAIFLGTGISKIIPRSMATLQAKRFRPHKEKEAIDGELPSFDLIRASINLVVSSALIAYGTSQKLPLSTTFVTFMVAMGTSFADQAWGRETAVYRVSGVIRVISGWLLTALLAFIGAATIAIFLFFTRMPGVVVIVIIIAFLLLRSQITFNKKEKKEKDKIKSSSKKLTVTEVIENSKLNTVQNLKTVQKIVELSLGSLLASKARLLNKSKKELEILTKENDKLNNKIIKYIRKMGKAPLNAGRLHLYVFDRMQDLYQSCLLISEVCSSHLMNHHTKPQKDYTEALKKVEAELYNIFALVEEGIASLDFSQISVVELKKQALNDYIQELLDQQIVYIQEEKLGSRIGLLQTRILLEINDITSSLIDIFKIYEDNSAKTGLGTTAQPTDFEIR